MKIINFFFGCGVLLVFTVITISASYKQSILFGSAEHKMLYQRLTGELKKLPFSINSYHKQNHHNKYQGKLLDIESAQCGPVSVANHCDNRYEYIHVKAYLAEIESDSYAQLQTIINLLHDTDIVLPNGQLKYRLLSRFCNHNGPCYECWKSIPPIVECSIVFPKKGNTFLTRRLIREVVLVSKAGKRIGLLT